MQYRKMPKSDDLISNLGFGCMRFPVSSDGLIDEDQSLEMLNYAYDNGVNYYDTAYPYHGGNSEPLVGKFISSHPRQSILLATKMPCWLIKEKADMGKYLDEQLKKLQTDYIDYYLLHALNSRSWQNMKKLKVLSFLEEAQKAGKIRHIGFSFHDGYKVFKKIVDSYDWSFCQIQFNYLDTHYQAGLKGYELAIKRSMGVIAMEPLRGGKLVHPVPTEIHKIWQKHKPGIGMVEHALNWVWDHDGISTILSGMSDLQQLKENLALSSKATANSLSLEDHKLYAKIRRTYLKRIAVLCSGCRYCLPCPSGVAIPDCLGMYNEGIMFDDKSRATKEYNMFIPESAQANKCSKCGICVSKCPQNIDIPGELQKVLDYFGK